MKQKIWAWVLFGITGLIAITSLVLAWRLNQEDQITEEEAAASENVINVTGGVYCRAYAGTGVEGEKIPIPGVTVKALQWEGGDNYSAVTADETGSDGIFTMSVKQLGTVGFYVTDLSGMPDELLYDSEKYDLAVVKSNANIAASNCSDYTGTLCTLNSGQAGCGAESAMGRSDQIGEAYENCNITDQSEIVEIEFVFRDPCPTLIELSGTVTAETYDGNTIPVEGVSVRKNEWQLVVDKATNDTWSDYYEISDIGETDEDGYFTTEVPSYGSIGIYVTSLDEMLSDITLDNKSYSTANLESLTASNCSSDIYEAQTGCWLNTGQDSCSLDGALRTDQIGQAYENCNLDGVTEIQNINFKFTEVAGASDSADLVSSKTANDTTPKIGDTVEYTISYQSTIELTEELGFKDVIPSGLTYVDDSAEGDPEADCEYTSGTRTLSCTIDDPGTSGEITYSVTADEAGTFQNNVTLTSGDSSDTATATITASVSGEVQSETGEQQITTTTPSTTAPATGDNDMFIIAIITGLFLMFGGYSIHLYMQKKFD